jgi:HAD superfamily hydrolase (TIGR01549 family)
MLKSIVFDLDGTLIDSPLNFDKIRNALGMPEGEYILEYIESLDDSLRAEKHRILEDIEVEAAKEAVLIEGALQILKLADDLKMPTAIFTRNCRAVTDIVMANFALPVTKVITRNDAKAKPDPEGLNILLESWQQAPSEMLYVGDYRFDVECGKKAGVRTALYTAGKPLEDNYGAEFVFDSYAMLIRQLKEANLLRKRT